MNKLRFAILGFGHHATRRLLPAFARSSAVSVVGLWRRNSTQAAQDAQQNNLRAFSTAEELCQSPEVDAVFITSPDAMHLADAKLAFAHGKAVLCEKPLAMNAGEAAEMQEAAAQAGVLFGVGQNFRFNESVRHLRAQIAKGTIGTPQFATAQYSYLGTRAPRKWITDPLLACGGPIADVGVHCIDALRFILAAEVRSVDVLASKDAESGDVEAISALQLQMDGGVFAHVTTSARAPYRTLLEVAGSEGVLTAENGLSVDRPVDVVLHKAGDLIETRTFSNEEAYVQMLDAFAAAYRGEAPFEATGLDGLLNQRILDAAFRSWHSGHREML